MTKAESFHPMRGHVYHGNEIIFSNGDILTLNNTVRGWILTDAAGVDITQPMESAFQVDDQIIKEIKKRTA